MAERQQRTAEGKEGCIKVCPALIADGEAAHLVQVRERALDDPPMPPELRAGVDPQPCDAHRDAPLPELAPGDGEVIRLVRMQFLGSAPRPSHLAAQRRDRIEERSEDRDLRFDCPA
jgi:hypothetical protein